MAGYSTTRGDIDARIGSVATALRDALDDADRINTWFTGKTTAELVAIGYNETEVAEMKSAYSSLAALKAVAHGQQAVPTADDFFFWARRLTGLQ